MEYYKDLTMRSGRFVAAIMITSEIPSIPSISVNNCDKSLSLTEVSPLCEERLDAIESISSF